MNSLSSVSQQHFKLSKRGRGLQGGKGEREASVLRQRSNLLCTYFINATSYEHTRVLKAFGSGPRNSSEALG